jgi:hypothetical protein
VPIHSKTMWLRGPGRVNEERTAYEFVCDEPGCKFRDPDREADGLTRPDAETSAKWHMRTVHGKTFKEVEN